MPVVDAYIHSPAGPEGASGSISEHRVSLSNSMLNSSFLGRTPPSPREVQSGDRSAARMGQQVAPALQQSHSSRSSTSGHEWTSSHQPSRVRSGNAVSLHNVQEQHHYVRGALGNLSLFAMPSCSRADTQQLKLNLLLETCRDPQAFPAPPTIYVEYRIVVSSASSSLAFKNNWIIAKRT